MTSTSQSPASGPGSDQPVTTLLGKGSEFEGKLSFEGTVRVDGKLTGEIFTEDVLIVGESADVNAKISVGSVIIDGRVRGNVTAKRSVEIHRPARVTGDISTPSLFVEKGAFFDGRCQMESGSPVSDSPPPPRHAGGKKADVQAGAHKLPAEPASAPPAVNVADSPSQGTKTPARE
jgi:cytoskeletal protein CcmA (bactofilin family)